MRKNAFLYPALLAMLAGGCVATVHGGKGATIIANRDRKSLEKEFKAGEATAADVLRKLGPHRQI